VVGEPEGIAREGCALGTVEAGLGESAIVMAGRTRADLICWHRHMRMASDRR